MDKIYKNKECVKDFLGVAELPKIRKDFIAKLENALMFLNYKHLNIWHSEAIKKASLKEFDGAWLLDLNLRLKEGENFAFRPFGDLQVSPDMFPEMNMKFMNLSGELGMLEKYRFLNAKEKRNLSKFMHIFSHSMGILDYGKQRWFTSKEGYGINKMKEKKDIKYALPIHTPLRQGYYFKESDIKKRIEDAVNGNDDMYLHMVRGFHLSLQLSLTYHYEWSCYIKENDDSIGIRIPIHPSSSKEVFVLRNIPEGKKRRAAIVNFVKDHYRTIKGLGNEREVLIKKHLRGDLKFTWRGLKVQISPSPYDINKYKKHKN